MYESVVIPVDGSDHSQRAAEHAHRLAGQYESELHLLAVVDVQAAAGPFSLGGLDEEFLDRTEQEGREVVDETLAGLDTDSVRVQTAVQRGKPAETIIEYADEHDASLLALGTRGQSGLGRYVTGSIAESVVREADRPVLTVQASENSDEYEEILVPTDGSERAATAIDHAMSIASEFDARLHAVNVVDVTSLATNPMETFPTDLLETLVAAGEDETDRIRGRAKKAGIDVTTTVTKGSPGDELLSYAAGEDIDLITMATAGRTGLDRYLLGSTTERVIRHATAPVLSVKG